MTDSTHCSQCNGPLTEVDFYGARLVGCIEVDGPEMGGSLSTYLRKILKH